MQRWWMRDLRVDIHEVTNAKWTWVAVHGNRFHIVVTDGDETIRVPAVWCVTGHQSCEMYHEIYQGPGKLQWKRMEPRTLRYLLRYWPAWWSPMIPVTVWLSLDCTLAQKHRKSQSGLKTLIFMWPEMGHGAKIKGIMSRIRIKQLKFAELGTWRKRRRIRPILRAIDGFYGCG